MPDTKVGGATTFNSFFLRPFFLLFLLSHWAARRGTNHSHQGEMGQLFIWSQGPSEVEVIYLQHSGNIMEAGMIDHVVVLDVDIQNFCNILFDPVQDIAQLWMNKFIVYTMATISFFQ